MGHQFSGQDRLCLGFFILFWRVCRILPYFWAWRRLKTPPWTPFGLKLSATSRKCLWASTAEVMILSKTISVREIAGWKCSAVIPGVCQHGYFSVVILCPRLGLYRYYTRWTHLVKTFFVGRFIVVLETRYYRASAEHLAAVEVSLSGVTRVFLRFLAGRPLLLLPRQQGRRSCEKYRRDGRHHQAVHRNGTRNFCLIP